MCGEMARGMFRAGGRVFRLAVWGYAKDDRTCAASRMLGHLCMSVVCMQIDTNHLRSSVSRTSILSREDRVTYTASKMLLTYFHPPRLLLLLFPLTILYLYCLHASPSAATDSIFVRGALGTPPPYSATANPLSHRTSLHYGPWQLTSPSAAVAGLPFTLSIVCTAAAGEDCPESYYVQYYGPTAGSVPARAFRVSADGRTVTAAFAIADPGKYAVYAWPNALACAAQQDAGVEEAKHMYRRMVRGAPARLTIAGKGRSEGRGGCAGFTQAVDARWVRTESLRPEVKKMYAWPKSGGYVYVPYDCKIPHRTAGQALAELATESVLFLGDSVTRGYVCSIVWPQLFGRGCDDDDDGGGTHGNRYGVWDDPAAGRKVHISFVFLGAEGLSGSALQRLRKMQSPPGLVVYNVGLQLPDNNEWEMKSEYRRFFDEVDALWGEGTRVVVKATTSVVQPVSCLEKGGHGRDRSDKLRAWMHEETRKWRHRRKAFVDAFALTDTRPETTLDGLVGSPFFNNGRCRD